VHSRCNLACDYCYVYQLADQSWRTKPKIMSMVVLRKSAMRIAEHARQHELARVRIILHGGEPLLAGKRFIRDAAAILRTEIPSGVQLEITAQTNGVLLDEEFLATLLACGIGLGVSLDGHADAHDQRRRHLDGRPSHAQVTRALRLLGGVRFRPLFRGLLCTIDLAAEPLSVYSELLSFGPPTIDFLLPHGNWASSPPGRGGHLAATPYADWLVTIFDEWYLAPATRIRLFEAIISLLLGAGSESEQVGLGPASVVVVETDGAIEQTDALKSAYEGAADTGLNVIDHTFTEALAHPGVMARQAGLAGLPDDCLGCRVRNVCGGGFYPHRYHPDTGFKNRSVYCPDLLALISHIRERVAADLLPLRL